MDTAVRTLPIRTQPIETEALDSWLEATSHRLSSTWDDFTEAVGLRRRGPHLTPAEAAAISAATGHPAAQPFETEAR
jgi:hypothetical protein